MDEIKINKKILEDVCKVVIKDMIVKSKYLKENTTFEQQRNLYYMVNSFTYEQTISYLINDGKPLTEADFRQFESKFGKFLRYGLAAIAGGYVKKNLFPGGSKIIGPAIGMVVLYLYRKFTDPCIRQCYRTIPTPSKHKSCKAKCELDAIQKIVRDLKVEMSKCKGMSNPIKCEQKLTKQFYNWNKKLQKAIVKYREASAGENEAAE